MRSRSRVLQSLEGVYREAFDEARERDDKAAMGRLIEAYNGYRETYRQTGG